ncbi:DUF4296 domain-containing protein [Hymenobacter sp. H14-R3]|uniref:DUF4296 domain-containing protein n=1 Tax=Hymenobacter sp. H14-R3 TaxID=3046308 RepID=UPI0024B9D9B9|nr:DUF4296 domain-containing protein [Hymenobacter sp. H14-R3]MDJ0365164.1 DUF4296 domain-containing protein [Hymenobacter sp. H14-R3]
MLTRFLLGLGLLLALAGCGRPEQVLPPPNLLSKQEVTSLLIQFHLLESRLESSRLSPDSARALFLSQQLLVLQRHHVPTADSAFERSYRYYSTHAKDLDEIYVGVIDSLEAMNKKMGGQPTPVHN